MGFIGLGLMGRPMALSLLRAGHALTVWSRRPESMRPLLAEGAMAATGPADVARRCEAVISMVPDAPDVERVALGPGGVVEGAHPGLVFIDMSTVAPEAARDISARLAEHGVTMLDAPVSGGESGAIQRTLTIMAGGDADAFERVKPLFEAMGRSVSRIGGPGAGQVAKACNQIITGVAVSAMAEAFNFARRSGVDGFRVREALLGGFAWSRILEHHGQRMLERDFRPGFKSWMHRKDLHIVMDEAHRLGVALPAAAAAAQMFNGMAGSGFGEEDSVAMIRLLERMSGVEA